MKLNRRDFFSCLLGALFPALVKRKTEFRVPLILQNLKAFQADLKAFQAVNLRSAADAITEQEKFIVDCFRDHIYISNQLDVQDTPLYDTISYPPKARLHGDSWSIGKPWKVLALLAVSAVFAVSSSAQTTTPHACFQAFHFTGAAQIQQMADNLQTLCNNFTITYSAQGFGALSLLVQDAPDAGNTPGTWVTYAGTVNTGSNPNTSITGGNASTNFTGFFRWVRVNLSSVTGTGTVDGVIYGDQVAPSPGTSGSGGTACPNPCPVIGPTAVGSPSANPPVQISELDGNGNLIIPTLGTLSAAITVSASGLTQIVALSAAKSIRIAHLSIAFASGVNFQLEYGTGANCAAGTTALTGVYQNIATYAYDAPGAGSPLIVPASQALCINLGTGIAGGGVIQYALF